MSHDKAPFRLYTNCGGKIGLHIPLFFAEINERSTYVTDVIEPPAKKPKRVAPTLLSSSTASVGMLQFPWLFNSSLKCLKNLLLPLPKQLCSMSRCRQQRQLPPLRQGGSVQHLWLPPTNHKFSSALALLQLCALKSNIFSLGVVWEL